MEKRSIRTYVIRKGRMTDGQRGALERHWAHYGLDVEDGVLGFATAFPREAPLTLEIGFGMGDSLFEMASTDPQTHFVGVEVHPPGVGHLLIKAAEAGLENLKVYMADGIDVVRDAIAPESVDRILILFPDPWHKKKHHKRRLIEPDFARLLASRLKPLGILHIATDWLNYAESIAEVMAGIDSLEPVAPPPRPQTKYERRGLTLGHEVTDLAFRKRDTKN